MFKKQLLGLVLLGFLFASASAYAGNVFTQGVNVVTSLKRAYGSMQGARYSTDSVQYIYCVTNGSGYGSCYAKNASSVFKSCYTTNPEFLSVIRSMTAFSYFTFEWDDTGKCTYISANNGSQFIK